MIKKITNPKVAGCPPGFRPSVCVVYIKAFFLHVDIENYQCPCRCFNPRETQDLRSQTDGTDIPVVAYSRNSSRHFIDISPFWMRSSISVAPVG